MLNRFSRDLAETKYKENTSRILISLTAFNDNKFKNGKT